MPVPYNSPDDYDKIEDDTPDNDDFRQTGKSYRDMLPYFLSGEADDFPIEFGDSYLD